MTATETTTTTTTTAGDLAAMVTSGTDALNDGDLRLALERFESVVMAFPDRPEGHNNLGALYASIGEFEKAEMSFDRVLGLLPDNTNVMYNRGLVRSRLEKFAAAREDFEAVLTATPNDPDTLNNLGVAAFMTGELDEARRHLEHAVAIRPGYVNATLNLVDVVVATGDMMTGIGMCEEFLATYTDGDVTRRHLDLQTTMARELLSQAAITAEAILISDPDDTVQAELGRIRQASAAWQKVAAATM